MGVLFFFYFGKCGELNFYPGMKKIIEYFFCLFHKKHEHEARASQRETQLAGCGFSPAGFFFFRELIKRCISTDLL